MTEEGKKLILATKPYAKEFVNKSWMHTISTSLLLIVFYTLSYITPSNTSYMIMLKIALAVCCGLLLIRMFIIYHDYLHKAILNKSKAANVIFTIFGLLILAPKSIWKRSHDYHHKHNSKLYTSSIGSFPIVTVAKFKSFNTFDRNVYLFIRHPLTITFGYLFAFIYGMCIQPLVRSTERHLDCGLSLLIHLAIGTSVYIYLGPFAFLISFLLPHMISCGMGSYLFYAQHNFPTSSFEDKHGWTYIKAALNSSSYMKMGALMNWITGNIGYHHIHHLNARIPFYRLPEVFHDIPALQNARTTSLHPKDIVACLKLKVWDPEQQKLVPLPKA
jgi:omega-6 fatty acid desaturase (delta-12 desaturase)